MSNLTQKGKKEWYFPDAEIPPMGNDEEVYGHESIIVLNPNDTDATIVMTLFWTDREPTIGLPILVESKRVSCFRANERSGFLGGVPTSGEQYSVMLESDVPIIAQYGRLDVRQSNMAFYTTTGYQE